VSSAKALFGSASTATPHSPGAEPQQRRGWLPTVPRFRHTKPAVDPALAPGAEKVKETNGFWLPRIRGNTC